MASQEQADTTTGVRVLAFSVGRELTNAELSEVSGGSYTVTMEAGVGYMDDGDADS